MVSLAGWPPVRRIDELSEYCSPFQLEWEMDFIAPLPASVPNGRNLRNGRDYYCKSL